MPALTTNMILSDIRRRLSGRVFAMFIAACQLAVADDLLRVEAVNRFMRDWIERTLRGTVEDVAKNAGLRGIRIVTPDSETLF